MGLVKQQYYKIFLAGKELDSYYMDLISRVTYEDKASGSDLLYITLADPDFKIIGDSLFVEDKAVWFEGGWLNEKPVVFAGFISIIDINFPEEGTPSITLVCMDNSHLMNRSKKKRTWKDTTVSSVARNIFTSHGLVPVIDPTSTVEETISQGNITDIALLIRLAKDQYEDYIVYVEENKGYFVKRDILKTPQKELEYRSGDGELISFSPRINKETKQEKIDNSDVNTETGKVEKDEATNESARELQGENSKGLEYTGGSTWKKE